MKKEYGILIVAAIIVGVIVLILHTSISTHDRYAGHKHHLQIMSERDFIEHMIPHHAEAVTASSELLTAGGAVTPALRTLAEAILTDQSREIEQMKQWYENWYGETYEDKGDYLPMMRPVSLLKKDDMARVYATDMIAHHQAAILSAEAVLDVSPRAEIANLARGIIETQKLEISLLEEVLANLPAAN